MSDAAHDEITGPCIELIEQLCACMRAVGAHGSQHDDSLRSLEECRRAIARAEPPYSLRFLSDGVLRDRTPLALSLSGFRRAQVIARVLHQLDTAELRFDEVPTRETLAKLVRVFVDSTQGTHRSFAPKLKGIQLLPLAQVDPTSAGHDDAEADRVLRAELHRISELAEGLRARMSAPQGSRWSWSQAQAAIAALERCLMIGVTVTGRALELAPPEWTLARRATAATAHTLIALTRLRTTDLTRRAAAHAMLALSIAGLPDRSFEQAARDALAALNPGAAASAQPNPHRLRTLALLGAAEAGPKSELATTRLLHAAYTLERRRVDDTGQRLSSIDMQAWLAHACGREIDAASGRLLLGALGALPPGAHVLCDGRLAVVMGPGETPLTPLVLVGGELKTPELAVAPSSPLGMSPWAK